MFIQMTDMAGHNNR